MHVRVLAALASLAIASGCQPAADDLVLLGTVERTLIDVVAPVSEQIAAIEVERGQHVAAGEVIVRLDTSLALSALASAEAELAGARTASVIAGIDLDRAVTLHASKVIATQQLDRAQLARDEAAARLWAAEARVAAERKRLADHTLVAPVDGVVDQIPFDRGERVGIGSVLAVILQDGPPWVRVWLPERAYASVAPGTEARVRLDGVAGELRGRVLDVSREPEFTPHFALSERERVYLVYETRVGLDESAPALRAGAPATVSLLPGAPAQAAR